MTAAVRLAVFDCDGTLVDSAGTIVDAMARAFADLGVAWPGAEPTRRIIGRSLLEAVGDLAPELSPAMRAEIAARYKAVFQEMRAAGRAESVSARPRRWARRSTL